MRATEGAGRLAMRVAPPIAPGLSPLKGPLPALPAVIPTALSRMLDYSMKHRTQLYLDEAQYRWLKQRAGKSGSIAAVVRELIDAERARRLDPAADSFLSYLLEEPPGKGAKETSVATLDRDLYGE
jgi:hypothetical protein